MFRILVCEINRFGDSIIRTNSVSSSASGPRMIRRVWCPAAIRGLFLSEY